jgi:hypothetical protein
MSTLREAAQQALEALDGELPGWRTPAQERAITALRAALARHHDDVAIANPHGGGVIYKTSAAATDAAIRAKLVELGWTPPTALAQQEQGPHWLTKELMADYLDMVAEAIENDSSETLRHKAHWMRNRGEV